MKTTQTILQTWSTVPHSALAPPSWPTSQPPAKRPAGAPKRRRPGVGRGKAPGVGGFLFLLVVLKSVLLVLLFCWFCCFLLVSLVLESNKPSEFFVVLICFNGLLNVFFEGVVRSAGIPV